MSINKNSEGRREFLRRSAYLSIAGSAAPWALNLAALSNASAQTASDGYKALVCVFMYGGNDHGNTVVPFDIASHNEYKRIRGGLAIDRSQLVNTALSQGGLPAGREMALSPSLLPLKGLFDAGNLGVLLNVGPLLQPTTLAQYLGKSVPLPPKLFSHNDQQSVWQSSQPEGSTSGWGGRIGDQSWDSNSRSTFTCVNASGNAVFMSGKSVAQYRVTPAGSLALRSSQKATLFGSSECAKAHFELVTKTGQQHLMQAELSRVMNRAIKADADLTKALESAAPLSTTFDPANSLAMQLQIVARMISARGTLLPKLPSRQVFFVSLGGFDTHDNLVEEHPILLAKVANAMKSFYDATVELGVARDVTTFTASDFGRTLTSNGDGSDHGWGGHHFVLGGAVNGGRFYGTLPSAALGVDDVGQGRLLPTTSVDQLAATLASWMGMSDDDILKTVVPNITKFPLSTRNLGLFKKA
jgi:uncharacterized protein (DUF1501 family)